MSIDWSKAPEGFPLWLEGIGEHAKHSGWCRRAGEVFEAALGGQFRAVREGQFFTVHCKPEWDGRGLPPVGAVCEWKEKTGFSWVQATVLFITESSVVMQRSDGFEWQMLTKRTVFRPILTPEQIAAEEREKELNKMVATVSMLDKSWARKVCAGLYDAGYRKFEIVEEDV